MTRTARSRPSGVEVISDDREGTAQDALLNRTVARYGPYVMRPYTEPISSARGWQEALSGELLNVYFSDVGHRIIDEGMIPIPYPVDKGLLGYRICLIVKQDQAKIDRINSIDQLRALTVGQGRDWGDVRARGAPRLRE
jgi:hypothetical protein